MDAGEMSMKLSYSGSTSTFILRVPRGEADPRTIQEEHGLDFSTTASSPAEAVLLTREPYAAAAFWEYATEGAQYALSSLQQQIEASWATASTRHIDVPADRQLSPFQIAGVDYALGRRNTLIGDQPGL